VSDDAVLRRLHADAMLSMPVEAFMRRLGEEEIRERLRLNTEEVVKRGGFGSPTIFVSCPDGGFETEMHFGNDTLELVEAAVLRAQGRPWRFHDRCGVPRAQPGPLHRPSSGWAALTGGGE